MPFYSWMFVCPANSTREWRVEVEGVAVNHVRVGFPPGPSGLLKVAIFYGEKKIWPSVEELWFTGDGVEVAFDDYWPLPEKPCPLRVAAVNEDTVYDHLFYVRLKTEPLKEAERVKFRVTEGGFIEVEV